MLAYFISRWGTSYLNHSDEIKEKNEWLFKLNFKLWEAEMIQSGWKPAAVNVLKCYNVSAFITGVSGLAWKCSSAANSLLIKEVYKELSPGFSKILKFHTKVDQRKILSMYNSIGKSRQRKWCIHFHCLWSLPVLAGRVGILVWHVHV